MTSYSIMMPFMPTHHEQALTLAGLVQFGPAERVWHGQSLLVDSYHTFNYLAGSGFRMPVGFGVRLMPLRHPFEAAVQAQPLACATGHSVVAGFGPSAAVFQRSVLGEQYAMPLTVTRECVGIVRDVLDGNIFDRSGKFFSCRLDLPNLEEGAARVGRAMPRVVVVVPTALAANGRDPVDLVLAGNSGHLRLPHYQDMLRRSGIDIDIDDLRAISSVDLPFWTQWLVDSYPDLRIKIVLTRTATRFVSGVV